ncbi:MAG: hypothetical protein ABIF77_21645 [bacterium]
MRFLRPDLFDMLTLDDDIEDETDTVRGNEVEVVMTSNRRR